MQGSISIIISDNEKLLNDAMHEMDIMDSIVIKKGEQIGQRRALLNRWIYKKKFDDENYDNVINNFLNILSSKNDKIVKMINKYEEVEVILQIRSDYGQVAFTLNSNIINKISSLNIPLSFDILSFGLVKDD